MGVVCGLYGCWVGRKRREVKEKGARGLAGEGVLWGCVEVSRGVVW